MEDHEVVLVGAQGLGGELALPLEVLEETVDQPAHGASATRALRRSFTAPRALRPGGERARARST